MALSNSRLSAPTVNVTAASTPTPQAVADLAAERFVTDRRLGDERLHRTGDLVRFRVTDLVPERAEALCARLRERGADAEPVATLDETVGGAEPVLFATTAAEPYVHDAALFGPEQTVLNVSLRDLDVPVILAAQNVLDDVDHCLKANTSPHLAEIDIRGREFVAGTISDVLAGRLAPDPGRVRVFSPFGLGVLDLALARFIHTEALERGLGTPVGDFFGAE